MEKLERDRAVKRAKAFKALSSEGLDLPAPSTPQEQLHRSWGSATATPMMSWESSRTPMLGVLESPLLQMSPMGELQLGQPRLNTLPPWETWCPPLPSIIAMGWSVKVDYVIRTLQGSKKHVLGFESCSKPRVAQQEFAWSEAAAVPGWTSSVRPAVPETGAVALKRSRDPNSPPPPASNCPPAKG